MHDRHKTKIQCGVCGVYRPADMFIKPLDPVCNYCNRIKIQGIVKRNGETELYFGDKLVDLDESLKLRNHSPTGFAWGYLGSGPAQTALALLLEYTKDPKLSLEFYQRFKARVIAQLKFDHSFIFDSRVIRDFLMQYVNVFDGDR